MTKLLTTSVLLAAAFTASTASANTVLLDYRGQDEKVIDGERNYDFFSLEGPRVVIPVFETTEFDEKPLIDVRPIPFGPFRPDGRADMQIEVSDDPIRAFGTIRLLEQNNFPIMEMLAVQNFPQVEDGYNDYPMFSNIRQEGRFAFNEGGLATFGAGGDSGFLVNNEFEFGSSSAQLYNSRNNRVGGNLLEEEGDSAILGFRIDVFMDDFNSDWGQDYDFKECEIPLSIQIVDDGSNDNGPIPMAYECKEEPREVLLASYFGFVEVTRGSVTPGILGVNGNAFGAAQVPNVVPLPAPALLLGAGIAGLMGLRRRRKS
jgi:hypothetical protein